MYASTRSFGVALLLLALSSLTLASELKTGIILDIKNFTINVGLVTTTAEVCCDLYVYSGSAVYCIRVQTRRDKLDIDQDIPLQFRVKGHDAFIKAKNGKEMKGHLVQVDPMTAAGDSPPISGAQPLPLPRPLPGPSRYNPVIPLDLDLFAGTTSCAQISAILESGDFFRGFKARTVSNGLRFYNSAGLVDRFPEKITIKVLLSITPCAASNSRYNVNNADAFTFNTEFIESVRFTAFWMNGFSPTEAELHLLTRAQTSPTTASHNACSWEYQLDLWSQDIPLTDILVIKVMSGDKLFTRFSSRRLLIAR